MRYCPLHLKPDLSYEMAMFVDTLGDLLVTSSKVADTKTTGSEESAPSLMKLER